MPRVCLFLLAVWAGLCLLACDPPNFRWPDRTPTLTPPPTDNLPTPFDAWKATRLEQAQGGHLPLIVGAARVDLTPPDYMRLYVAGYQPNKQPTGLGEPITGRVLFLDDGRQSLFLIECDFVGVMNNDIWNFRHAISHLHAEDILIASTHNHAGPDTMGMWGPWAFFAVPMKSGKSPAYIRFVAQRLAEATMQAVRTAQPAHLVAAHVTVPEGVNENAHRAGFKDNEMTILQARDAMNVPLATLVNYTCHAEFLGGNNSKLSADFPGFFYRDLEALEGGVALYSNGALGGIVVPALPRHTEYVARLREHGARRATHFLAALAAQALATAESLDVHEIRVQRHVFSLPVDNERFAKLGQLGVFDRPMPDGHLYTEAWRIDLGALSIASVPGEIFPSLGFKVKAAMPSRYKMIIGLANDELGYIMDAPEWDDPLYDYERTVSVGPKTGPAILSEVGALFAAP